MATTRVTTLRESIKEMHKADLREASRRGSRDAWRRLLPEEPSPRRRTGELRQRRLGTTAKAEAGPAGRRMVGEAKGPKPLEIRVEPAKARPTIQPRGTMFGPEKEVGRFRMEPGRYGLREAIKERTQKIAEFHQKRVAQATQRATAELRTSAAAKEAAAKLTRPILSPTLSAAEGAAAQVPKEAVKQATKRGLIGRVLSSAPRALGFMITRAPHLALAGIALRDLGLTAEAGWGAAQAARELEPHIKAAEKRGVKVKKRGILHGLIMGDPGIEVE